MKGGEQRLREAGGGCLSQVERSFRRSGKESDCTECRGEL